MRLASLFRWRWLALGVVAVAGACAASNGDDPEEATAASSGDGASGGAGGATGASSNGGAGTGTGGALQGPCGDEPDTRIRGTVFAPNGVDPLYNVLVYVPGAEVEPFADGVECVQCGKVSGEPMVSALTDTQGRFELHNPPCDEDVPIVIQIGKWRRQLTLPGVACCADNVFDDPQVMRLPRNQSEGDMPKMAIVTGQIDNLECAFRKIGVDDSEFTLPESMGGSGRIQWFLGDGAPGAVIPDAPTEDQLWGDPDTLAKYDMVLLACQGSPYPRTVEAQQNMVAYADAGGRVLTTHYGYTWIHENEWSTTADWTQVDPGYGLPDSDGIVDVSSAEGAALAEWLMTVGASTQLGRIPVKDVCTDVPSVNAATTRQWITADPSVSANTVLHLTFDTPLNAEPKDQCGRVLYHDFHVEEVNLDYPQVFPQECVPGPMTAQEKLLEFMIYDLGACVGPPLVPK
jgi:hypothetical protein